MKNQTTPFEFGMRKSGNFAHFNLSSSLQAHSKVKTPFFKPPLNPKNLRPNGSHTSLHPTSLPFSPLPSPQASPRLLHRRPPLASPAIRLPPPHSPCHLRLRHLHFLPPNPQLHPFDVKLKFGFKPTSQPSSSIIVPNPIEGYLS